MGMKIRGLGFEFGVWGLGFRVKFTLVFTSQTASFGFVHRSEA